ncbi:hypothetical protein [Erwinia sp. V71]|uniref:hypothetical protein n=1 Tax=Erwinia sp. V71 TaxID=3369424 RepID=UPI003F63172D
MPAAGNSFVTAFFSIEDTEQSPFCRGYAGGIPGEIKVLLPDGAKIVPFDTLKSEY